MTYSINHNLANDYHPLVFACNTPIIRIDWIYTRLFFSNFLPIAIVYCFIITRVNHRIEAGMGALCFCYDIWIESW